MFRKNVFSFKFGKYRIIETRVDNKLRFVPQKRCLLFFWSDLVEYGYHTLLPTCRTLAEAEYEISRHLVRNTKIVHRVNLS